MSETVKILALAVLALAQIIQFLLMKKNGKVVYNPHPPGESSTCIDHTKELSRLGEAVENIEKRLDRIENKLNGRIKL